MDDRWLDPQTLEMLHRKPPQKFAPATTPDYSIVMLQSGGDRERMVRAVRRIKDCSDDEARTLLALPLPLVVHPDLSHHDAALGQFELVCCDAISVILPREVVVLAEPSYLKGLFAKLRQSEEFQQVTLRLRSLPSGPDSKRFLDQFLGPVAAKAEAHPSLLELRMFRKKARIMAHWGERIGADISVAGGTQIG